MPQKTGALDAGRLSALALEMMERHGAEPTPENYALWYHYALGDKPDLLREMDALTARSPRFTEDMGKSLHRRHFPAPSSAGDAVESAAVTMRETLAKILQVVSDYSGEAAQYNQQLGLHAAQLESRADGAPVQDMVQEIISRVALLRQSGDEFTARMNSSRKEIEKLRQDLDRATQESQYDFLTGVYNRKKLDKALQEGIDRAKAEGEDLCLLMIDINHFKRFNDRFGHLLGDEVLKIVARALKDSVRGNDIVARYGGEEFSVLLPGTPVKGAEVVAEALRKRIAGRELRRKDTGEIIAAITVSVGISALRPATDTPELLMKRADEALYKAKAAGRNRVKKEGE